MAEKRSGRSSRPDRPRRARKSQDGPPPIRTDAALRERVAALERELADERARAAELLDRQAATADILGIIARSRATSQPVLDAIARSAAELCGALDGVVHIREGEE